MADDIVFDKRFDLAPGVVEEVIPGVRRILCNNPSPFTYKGTTLSVEPAAMFTGGGTGLQATTQVTCDEAAEDAGYSVRVRLFQGPIFGSMPRFPYELMVRRLFKCTGP